jgi:hypothetical protein
MSSTISAFELWCTAFMSWGVPNIELAFKVLIPVEKQSDLNVSGLQELVFQSLPAGSREFIRSNYSMSFWKITSDISRENRLGAKKTLSGMQFDYENGSEAQGRAILLPPFAKIGPEFFEGMLKNHLHVLIHLSRREPYSPGVATRESFMSRFTHVMTCVN